MSWQALRERLTRKAGSGSFFAECDRDDKGHCQGKGGGKEHPRQGLASTASTAGAATRGHAEHALSLRGKERLAHLNQTFREVYHQLQADVRKQTATLIPQAVDRLTRTTGLPKELFAPLAEGNRAVAVAIAGQYRDDLQRIRRGVMQGSTDLDQLFKESFTEPHLDRDAIADAFEEPIHRILYDYEEGEVDKLPEDVSEEASEQIGANVDKLEEALRTVLGYVFNPAQKGGEHKRMEDDEEEGLTNKDMPPDGAPADAAPAIREIIHPERGKDGLFIQPDDNSPERETIEQHNRERFANHFHYADPFTGIARTFDPQGDYNCGRCNMAHGDKCLLVAPLTIDRKAGSCGDWENQDAADAEMPLGEKTIDTSGYGVAANGKGFGCHRCPYASKAIAPDSQGRDLYCGKGDMRVFALACCVLNGAETLPTKEQEKSATDSPEVRGVGIGQQTGPEASEKTLGRRRFRRTP